MTGVDWVDKKTADRIAGFIGANKRPVGYTWHHNPDMKTMELITTDLNAAIDHTGGAAMVRSKLQGGKSL